MTEIAPSCPISESQIPYRHRLQKAGELRGTAPNIPVIPNATDLPSLIRTVNMITDALRTLTTSLTVNNVYKPRDPVTNTKGSTYYSSYPNWEQDWVQPKEGFVYNKTRKNGVLTVDMGQAVLCSRLDHVNYHNRTQGGDPEFKWTYVKKFDQDA